MTLIDALRSAMRRAMHTSSSGSAARLASPLPPGSRAPAISGVSPEGSPRTVDRRTVDPRAVEPDRQTFTLLFMTSECRECQPAWSALESTPESTLVVTPGPETDSRRRVAQLASAMPDRVIMSSAAWHSYGVTKAPWVVEIQAGVVVKTEPLRTVASQDEVT